MEQVVIKISKLGNLDADAKGFVGRKCTAVTDTLFAKLGGAKGTVTEKPEIHMAESIEQDNEQHLSH